MSDAYYEERARHRTQRLLIAGAVVVIVACAGFGLVSLFHDACTQSFDRSPDAVVSAYLQAVTSGDAQVAQECWEHETYYDLEAGCSEICLSKAMEAHFQAGDILLSEPYTTPEGRANQQATVSISCTEGGETHTAEILLDSVGGNAPWKHWSIIHSTLGGTVAEPWCK